MRCEFWAAADLLSIYFPAGAPGVNRLSGETTFALARACAGEQQFPGGGSAETSRAGPAT